MSENKTIKLAIADDHKLFRVGIAHIFSSIADIEVVAEAANGQELIDLIKGTAVDVVLLDYEMPILNGKETLDILKRDYPETKVLMLTMIQNEEYMIHFMQAGAGGYLLKDTEPKELEHAVRKVMETGTYLSDAVSQAVMKQLMASKPVEANFDSSHNLGERELEVLRLICKEFTTQEIAEQLFLSTRTIETYRKRLLEKTGARNSAGLVMFAMENGLIEK
jgi:DNA-binding NarL/FixJ family response regulator